MKPFGVVILLALASLSGCSQSTASTNAKVEAAEKITPTTAIDTVTPEPTVVVAIPDVQIQITDAALPVLRSAMASAKRGEVVIYSMKWPAGLCSTQHYLEFGRPKASDQTVVVSGIPIAFPSKYGRFVSGTVIDYGSRGSESGLKLKNDTLDIDAIVHSESDSALMIEMLGDGFEDFRDAVLEGKIVLQPKSIAE